MCDIRDCDGDYEVILESGHMVCAKHGRPDKTKYICKHCKVQIVSRTNHRAILGREHKKGCPRRRNGR